MSFENTGSLWRDYRIEHWNGNTEDLIRWFTELCAEAVGTMLFTAVGSVARDPALTNGLLLSALVFSLAPVSGAKLNPAVSLASYLEDVRVAPNGEKLHVFAIGGVLCLLEWGVQLGGASCGVALARKMTSSGGSVAGCFVPPTATPGSVVLANESVGTLLLVFTVLRTSTGSPKTARFGMLAPLAIGLALYAAADGAGRFTGGCFNPARYIAGVAQGSCAFDWAYASSYLPAHLLGSATAFIANWFIMFAVKTVNASPKRPTNGDGYVLMSDGSGSAPGDVGARFGTHARVRAGRVGL